MSVKAEESKEEPSEWEQLIDEKIRLASKLGIMGKGVEPKKGYEQTKEYQRITEIDARLWELVK
jgi:hypothetical protein